MTTRLIFLNYPAFQAISISPTMWRRPKNRKLNNYCWKLKRLTFLLEHELWKPESETLPAFCVVLL